VPIGDIVNAAFKTRCTVLLLSIISGIGLISGQTILGQESTIVGSVSNATGQ
jgi:hypothetical protein